MALGKDQYKVIRETYLKSNPDAYSDNLYYIPVGEVVAKDVSSEYPFIMITYKGEIGYVSLNDLAPLIKSENIDEIIEDTPPPPPPPLPPPPPTPTPLKTDYSLFFNKILSQIYLLVIIPILFFLIFIWKFLRLKSILKDAKQTIEKAIANIQETKPIVESTKSKIYNIIDLININYDLNSLKYNLKVLNSSNQNAINNLATIELEIKSMAEVIDATNSIKEALEVRNRAEILKSKVETALRDASDEKSVVEKEIDACVEKVKGLTLSSANKAISDAELAKNKIRNANSDISDTNGLIYDALANSKKYKPNLSTALNIALTKLERLKTNFDELKSEAEAVHLKANKVISDANATSKGVVSIKFAVDAKIAAERAKVSAADTLVEANMIKSKSETLKSNGEYIKTEVYKAIQEIKIQEIPLPPKVVKPKVEKCNLISCPIENTPFKGIYHMCYYVPNHEDVTEISRHLLNFKDGNENDVKNWIDLTAKELKKLNVDFKFIVRALGSSELEFNTEKPLHKLGVELAAQLSAEFLPQLIFKNKVTPPLKFETASARKRIVTDAYRVRNLLNKRLEGNILFIDDITTSGATANIIVGKIVEKYTNLIPYQFTLAKTIRDKNANSNLTSINF